jgi:redox-sensitive bicupin YhaK (pirin superfamily)
LFDGAIQHRDSLGSDQSIVPGDVNWMTSAHGIVHSERTAEGARGHSNRLFGMQSWVALPRQHEEMAPGCIHHGADALPVIENGGAKLRLIAGYGWGLRAPVLTPSELFYADAVLQRNRCEPATAIAVPA